MTAGGPRPGSGRKAGYRKEGAARELISIRLTPEERRLAETFGRGSVSLGIKRALQLWAETARWLAQSEDPPH